MYIYTCTYTHKYTYTCVSGKDGCSSLPPGNTACPPQAKLRKCQRTTQFPMHTKHAQILCVFQCGFALQQTLQHTQQHKNYLLTKFLVKVSALVDFLC